MTNTLKILCLLLAALAGTAIVFVDASPITREMLWYFLGLFIGYLCGLERGGVIYKKNKAIDLEKIKIK